MFAKMYGRVKPTFTFCVLPAICFFTLLISMNVALAQNTTITGAGSTFAAPIYNTWSKSYQKIKDVNLIYQAIGSTGGIKQVEARTSNFGASDQPLTQDQLKQNALVQFPTAAGGIVPIIHIPGIKLAPGQFKLSGPILANIYLGSIKKWNDPSIAALNPGITLPDQLITVIHRSDGSGTTFLFTNYLSKVSSEWKSKIGFNTTVNWPVGIGATGNEGVTTYVQHVSGAIGYVEYGYAEKNNLNYVQLKNTAGSFVSPSVTSFQAAAANVNWATVPNFDVILTNQPGNDSWPIVGATYVLMQALQEDKAQALSILQFFDWGFKEGVQLTKELGYLPMPENVVTLIENAWKAQIKDSQGNPIWPSGTASLTNQPLSPHK